MSDQNDKMSVADLTLERVRRLDEKLDRLLQIIATQNQKIDGLLDLATGTRADFAGFMTLRRKTPSLPPLLKNLAGGQAIAADSLAGQGPK